MPLKKKELYQFTVTHAGTTETRVDRQKARAIARCRAAVKKAPGPAEGVVHFQSADEKLKLLRRLSKPEHGKPIIERKS